MPLDFNNAPEQRESGLIADGSIVPVHVTVRPGGAGDGGWLKRSKSGESEALDVEFTVLEGPWAKSKFWTLFTVKGVSEGHEKAGEISAGKLRAMLESARGVKPDDKSPEAQAKRRADSWGDFDGIRCWVKVVIEKGTGEFKDKNQMDVAITPDRKEWTQLKQDKATVPPPASTAQQLAASAPTAKTAVSGKPSWAS